MTPSPTPPVVEPSLYYQNDGYYDYVVDPEGKHAFIVIGGDNYSLQRESNGKVNFTDGVSNPMAEPLATMSGGGAPENFEYEEFSFVFENGKYTVTPALTELT